MIQERTENTTYIKENGNTRVVSDADSSLH
jgi:hypothetical protein